MHPSFSTLCKRFTTVTHLSIRQTSFHTFNDFRRLLISFKNLASLELINVSWITFKPIRQNVEGNMSTRYSSFCLKMLYVDAIDESYAPLNNVFEWLANTRTTNTLLSIRHIPRSRDSESFQSLIEACAQPLMHLEVNLSMSQHPVSGRGESLIDKHLVVVVDNGSGIRDHS